LTPLFRVRGPHAAFDLTFCQLFRLRPTFRHPPRRLVLVPVPARYIDITLNRIEFDRQIRFVKSKAVFIFRHGVCFFLKRGTRSIESSRNFSFVSPSSIRTQSAVCLRPFVPRTINSVYVRIGLFPGLGADVIPGGFGRRPTYVQRLREFHAATRAPIDTPRVLRQDIHTRRLPKPRGNTGRPRAIAEMGLAI